MTQTLIIPGRLPGWNELNTGIWRNDRKVKNEAMELVGWEVIRQKIKPVGRASIKITCYEPNKRRDPSNVRAGAEKVILDQLQNSGIIRNDNWQWLHDTPPAVQLDREKPRTIVEVEETT